VATVALVVLLARWLAYSAEPSPSARFLEHRAGGPLLPIFALAALLVCASSAIAVCWLAALAVRERSLIERRVAPAFAVRRTLALAAGLALTASLAGGLLEAYVHWRAGLGWHGLHCLVGPVHRDLLPIETGLSLVAAAVIAAARHVAAWMRRTFARLAAQLPLVGFVDVAHAGRVQALAAVAPLGAASARAPPSLG